VNWTPPGRSLCYVGRDSNGNPPPWDRVSSRELARQATDESIVLLKNDNHPLPLDRAKLRTIAVIGPWTQEVLLDWYSGTPPYSVSILQGIEEAAKGARVLYSDGSNLAEAQSLARKADLL